MIRYALPTAVPRYRVIGTAGRSFSTTHRRQDYDSTLKNLKIGRHTRVIFQGFTGRQATANATESIEWGTNIVGGVRPDYEGEHLGLPVLPTVRKAMEVLKPDATGIYVAAHQAAAAIEEAIEAEVPLIVAVAEHIPLHDMLRVHAILKTQSKSRLVGANSPGIISSTGHCRIGFQPLPCFKPGGVGIVARSGTLSYETAASTLRSGLGQSMCIGVGGDILPGTTLLDGLRVLTEDPDTEAIALVGEIGGEAEIEAAEWIRGYRARTDEPKPIAALVAGVRAPPGRIMGHAGAFRLPGEPSAQEKIEALRKAGCAIVKHPSHFGPVLGGLLLNKNSSSNTLRDNNTSPSLSLPRRGMHTYARRRSTHKHDNTVARTFVKRSIHIKQSTALDLLRQRGMPIIEHTYADADESEKRRPYLAVTVNRASKNPCILASPSPSPVDNMRKFDFDYLSSTSDIDIDAIARHIGLPDHTLPSLRELVAGLVSLFMEKEAYLLETRLASGSTSDQQQKLAVASANLYLDDAAAYRRSHADDIQALSDEQAVLAEEVEANRHGIVYIRLPDPDPDPVLGEEEERGERKRKRALHITEPKEAANIGTLVNGAGLAMNTIDALQSEAGGLAANFLDTGGKATSETVKRSMEIILSDRRVKCIYVNIFGGLTRGDMIARGIVLALDQQKQQKQQEQEKTHRRVVVPIVVRIRGTNETEGQKIIAESGIEGLYAFDDFEEAAAKAVELANKS
ncbi:succinyl-CoA synthetase-like protein [Xylariaceae sp. FL0594]|nr:succinyl-CoA synthetase-like protein [Xylariaceae sp. FL0594]